MIKCLAIDDDPLFLKLINAYLVETPDIELIGTYTNPIDGVMAVVKSKPDVLLLDIEMPYMDGFETIATLDKIPKVLVISGHLNNPEIPDLPVDKFLSKRALKDVTVLESAIREVMNTK
ncbi:MAG: response regulator transcription factor [Cyclobacteriaceae bacterium]